MNKKHLALHVLQALARQHMAGRHATLQSIVDELDVRRKDIRDTISALHDEGYLDVLDLRLTMVGFAIGAGLAQTKLPPLRATGSSLMTSPIAA
jgi:DNA-binding IclR family transcriptional regulator